MISVRAVAALAAVATSFLMGVLATRYVYEAERDEKLVSMLVESSALQATWSDEAIQQEREHANAILGIRNILGSDLDGVRERPARLPEAPRKACTGASGRELARPDAEFLTRYAARAAEQQEALSLCYDNLDRAYAAAERCARDGDLLP